MYDEMDDFHSQVKQTTSRIQAVVKRQKVFKALGEKIANRLLIPLLEQLEDKADELAHEFGMDLKTALIDRINNSTPSGREYKIVRVDWGAEAGEGRYEEIGSYIASAAGQPPASYDSGLGLPTGTLVDSIDYRITGVGRVTVGLFESSGTEATTSFYAGGKVYIDETGGSQTSVTVYGTALDNGFYNEQTKSDVAPRPWYDIVIDEIKDDMHKKIRTKMHETVKQAVREGGRRIGANDIYTRITNK